MLSKTEFTKNPLSIELQKKQQQDYAYLIPFLREITQLLSSPKKDTAEERATVMTENKKLLDDYRHQLGDTMALFQKSEAEKVIQLKGVEITKQKDQLIKALNRIIDSTAIALMVTYCSAMNTSKGLGACEESAEVAAALLTYCEAKSHNKLFVETIAIANKLTPEMNHEFVVINRNPSSDCNKVATWGDDCLIFDPYMRKLYSINTIPFGFVLSSCIEGGDHTNWEISTSSYNYLVSDPEIKFFSEHPLLGQITKDSIKGLEYRVLQTLKDILIPVGLLKIEPTETPFSPGVTTLTDEKQPSMAQYLQHYSKLSFTTVVTAEYYTHLYALIKTAHEESIARQLISDFNYGRIRTTLSGQRMLFFANTNSPEHCKSFRDTVESQMLSK